MKQIVEKIRNCILHQKAGHIVVTGCNWVSIHLKTLGLTAVCLGVVTAFGFVCTGIYDLGYNILVATPTILIIGGAAAIVAGIKKDGKY